MSALGLRRDLACREAVDLMTAYLDGSMSRRDRTRFETHLAACEHCEEYLEQFRVTIRALRHVEPEQLDDDAVGELVALYQRWRSD